MRILRTILAVAFIAASSTSLFAQHGEKVVKHRNSVTSHIHIGLYKYRVV